MMARARAQVRCVVRDGSLNLLRGLDGLEALRPSKHHLLANVPATPEAVVEPSPKVATSSTPAARRVIDPDFLLRDRLQAQPAAASGLLRFLGRAARPACPLFEENVACGARARIEGGRPGPPTPRAAMMLSLGDNERFRAARGRRRVPAIRCCGV